MKRLSGILMTLAVMIAANSGEVAQSQCCNNLPAINTTGCKIDIINTTVNSCHVNDENDKVLLSVSGGSDYDDNGNQQGNIDYAQTRWTKTIGCLDVQTGSTNGWLATGVGPATIRVYLNDSDTGLHNDPESGEAAQVELIGFRVGCQLTTNDGGLWIAWDSGDCVGTQNSTMSGGVSPMKPKLSIGSPGLFASGSLEPEDFCEATYTLEVDPEGTPIKKNISAETSAAVVNGAARARARDDDWFDGGSQSLSAQGTVYEVAALKYTFDWENDNTVGLATGAWAFDSTFQSNRINGSVTEESDTEDLDTEWSSITFSHSASGYLVDKPGGQAATGKSAVRVGADLNVLEDTGDMGSAEAESEADYRFRVENVSYVN